MTDFIQIPFSGSTNGIPIDINAANLAGAQTIHTAIAGTASGFDEIWLWASNSISNAYSAQWLTLAHGYDNTVVTLVCNSVKIYPLRAPILILPGFLLQNGKTIKAHSNSGSISIFGYVKRIV